MPGAPRKRMLQQQVWMLPMACGVMEKEAT
jgi:hypothetical protein